MTILDLARDVGDRPPSAIEEKISPRTKAVIAVHLYGHPAHMGRILELARRHQLIVIEDAAEAHGAEYEGRRVRIALSTADALCRSRQQ